VKSKKFIIALTALMVMLLVIVTSVSAITNGELDGDGHP